MKTFFGTGHDLQKSVRRSHGAKKPRLSKMLLAGEPAFDHMPLGAVARELVDERSAMAAIGAAEGTRRDVGRKHVGTGNEPGMRFVGGDRVGGLGEREVLEHEN